MRNDELYIDGKLVDLDDSTKITLNYKSNIFTDLSKIVGNNSYTIKLPNTVHNQCVIEHADIPSCETDYPRKKHIARYFRSGVEIIDKANVILMSVGNTFDIALTWGNATAFASILNKNKKLTDLSSDKSFDWQIWGDDYYYGKVNFPKINYGFHLEEKQVWRHPAAYVSWILEEIEKENGVKFIFSEDKKKEINAMFVPLLSRNDNEKLAKECAITLDYKGRVPGTNRMYYNAKGNGGIYGDTRVEYYKNEQYLSRYFSLITNGVAKISGHMEVVITAIQTPVSPCIVVRKANQSPNGTDYENDEVLTIQAKSVDIIEGMSNKYKAIFDFADEQTSILTNKWRQLLHTVYGCNINFTLENLGGSIQTDRDISGTMTVVNMAEKVILRSFIGTGSWGDNFVDGTYYVAPNLPDIKQSDFIKAIASLLGVFAVSSDNNTIYFVAVDNIVANKEKAVNWTTKIISPSFANKPKEMTYALDGFAQKNWFKWKEDNSVAKNYDGLVVVEDMTIEYERDVIALPFSGTEMKDGIAYIPIYSYEANGNLIFGSAQPRLLIFKNDKGTFEGLEWNSIIQKNYQSYQKIIKSPRIIKERIEINDIGLKKLDVTVPIYLGQYGRYYAIISVKAEDSGICECELLQLDI